MKKTDKRIARGEKTRKRIMEYAFRIFNERGIRKVTVEDLCSGLSISKRTFYKYFSGRDALAEEIILERLTEYGPMIFENLISSAPVNEVLATHFDLLINRMFGNVSTQMFVDFQLLFPETWEKLELVRKEIVSLFAGLLRRGQQEGHVRKDIDPVVVGKIMQGLVTSMANPQFLMSIGLSMDEFIGSWQKIYMNGLLITRKQS